MPPHSRAASRRLSNGNADVDSDGRRAALVRRTNAEEHRCGQPWRGHADLGAAGARRQRPRPRLCRQGRQARRFRRHRPAQQQRVLRDHALRCGNCGATPTSLSWRLPRGEAAAVLDILKPALVVGGEADWNAPNSVPANFAPEGLSDEPLQQPGGALLEGDDQRRLDRTAQGDPRSSAGRGRHRRATRCSEFRATCRCSIPARSTTTPRSSCRTWRLFAGGRLTGMVKFDAEEALRLIAANRVQWVNFVPTMMHRIWALPDEVRNRYDLSSLQIVFHMAAPMPPWLKEKWIEWLGPEKNLRALWRHRAAGRLRDFRRRMAGAPGFGRQDRRNLRACASSAKTATMSRPARPARSISCPMTASAAPITISAPSRSAVPTAGNRSAISAGSMPTAISISATGSPT